MFVSHSRWSKRRWDDDDYDDDHDEDDDDDDDDDDDRRSRRRRKRRSRKRYPSRRRSRRPQTDDLRSGHDTLASIERALSDIERQEKLVQQKIEAVNAAHSDLLTNRLDAYRSLAEVRARSALADGVINQADQLSLKVASLLKARQKSIADLKERHEEASQHRDTLISHARDATQQIEALEQRLDELADQADDALKSDTDYKALSEEIDKSRKVLRNASQKAEVAETDRKSKGLAYENDPLFMYLWNRKFRSQEYEASNLIRWLDEKLASFINYRGARANYAVLIDIPEKLRAHVDRLGEQLVKDEKRLSDMKAAKIKELAGTDLADELAAARKRLNEINSKIDTNAAEITEADAQLITYLEGRDRTFQQAIEVSATLLQQDSMSQLMRLARQTPEPTDDQLVERIERLESDIEKRKAESDKLRAELDTLFKRREELIRISSDFRQSHYDDPGSVFEPGSGMEGLLEEFLKGIITGAEYWSRSQRRQRWRHRPGDPYRRSSSLPPFGDGWAGHWDIGSGSWGGGSWGGSSTGSWGSSRRGGFDTGGSF